jgi:hypothetical protein
VELGPGVEVAVGVEDGVRIGVALGGEVAVGGKVGAAVSVAATMVAILSGGGSPAGRVHAASVSPSARNGLKGREGFME